MDRSGSLEGTGVIVTYATFPSLETAKAAARRVVERRLAACVNIIPGMTSVYVWEGAVQEDAEVSVLLKTSQSCQAACVAALIEGHPYTTPAAVTWEATGGSAAYLAWVLQSTQPV